MELVSDKVLFSPQSSMTIEDWQSLIYDRPMILDIVKNYSVRSILKAIAANDQKLVEVSISEKGDRSFIDMAVDASVKPIKVEKTVTINRSSEDLYNFWRNLANLPTFTKNLKSITVIDAKRSHWIANAPLGMSVKWDAEIILDRENYLIGWASTANADIDNAGFVRFKPATGGRGTEVKVVMEYNILGGAITAAIAKLLGEEPENQIGEDLHRFKQFMETGEIATTEGQSSGRN